MKNKYANGGQIASTIASTAAGMIPGIGAIAAPLAGMAVGAIDSSISYANHQRIQEANRLPMNNTPSGTRHGKYMAHGGKLSQKQFKLGNGGNLKKFVGNSHEKGGIPVTASGNVAQSHMDNVVAEVEGGETEQDGYVFSKRLVGKDGRSMAERSESIAKRYARKNNDWLTTNSKKGEYNDLKRANDVIREKKEMAEQVIKEQLQGALNQMGNQSQPMQNPQMADGGGIPPFPPLGVMPGLHLSVREGLEQLSQQQAKKAQQPSINDLSKMMAQSPQPNLSPAYTTFANAGIPSMANTNPQVATSVTNKGAVIAPTMQNSGITPTNAYPDYQAPPTSMWGTQPNVTSVPDPRIRIDPGTNGFVPQPPQHMPPRDVGTPVRRENPNDEQNSEQLQGQLSAGDKTQILGNFISPAYNLGQALGSPAEREKPEQNRRAAEAMDIAKNLRVTPDYRPLMAQSNATTDTINSNATGSSRLAALLGANAQQQGVLASAAIQNKNQNNQLQAGYAQAIQGLGEQERQERIRVNTANAQNRATRQNFLASAVGQTGAGIGSSGSAQNAALEREISRQALSDMTRNFNLNDNYQVEFDGNSIKVVNKSTGKENKTETAKAQKKLSQAQQNAVQQTTQTTSAQQLLGIQTGIGNVVSGNFGVNTAGIDLTTEIGKETKKYGGQLQGSKRRYKKIKRK